MEKISIYLEKLGYTTEIQGGIVKYMVVLKDNEPIGFIRADYSLSLIDKLNEPKLTDIINFVRENENLHVIGGHEYLIASYLQNQLTTFYDSELLQVRFVSYTVSQEGEVNTKTYSDPYEARLDFVGISSMLSPADIKKGGGKIKNRVLDAGINLLQKARN